MKGYAYSEVFSKTEKRLLVEAKKVVSRLPLRDADGRYTRCHEVARFVGTMLGLQVCDGHYGMAEHSWLWTTPFVEFASLPNILDTYAIGRVPLVQLIHTSLSLPFEYRRGDKRKDIRPKVLQQFFELTKGTS